MPENAGQLRPPYHPHDKGYRQLLSDKRVFLELLKTFVRETWVEAIDEKDLILVNKSYVLQDFSEKEADIVYRLKTKDRNVIFYVLLELQSTVDYLIPFRLLLYMVEIWREIYTNTPQHERESKHFRLPPIIPAVLYNGPDPGRRRSPSKKCWTVTRISAGISWTFITCCLMSTVTAKKS